MTSEASQLRRASASMEGETSTPTTCPARRAAGMSSRPTPQPYSRTRSGAKVGSTSAHGVSEKLLYLTVARGEEPGAGLLAEPFASELRFGANTEVGILPTEGFPVFTRILTQHGR